MSEVWVLSAKRTPIGKFLGGLSGLHGPDLGTHAAMAALAIGPGGASVADGIDQAIFGCARQAGVRPNPARQIAYRAGVPIDRPSFTVNMACASGLKSVLLGAQAIRIGDAEAVLAGGFESMSNVPHLLMRSRFGYRLGHQQVVDAMYQDGFECPLCDQAMGDTAEALADRAGLGREDADRYALESQRRAVAAREAGHFAAEIAPIEAPGLRRGTVHVEHDEHPRAGLTLAKLSKLAAVFRDDGVVTAGNASGINDAGAALVLSSPAWAKARGIEPIARLGASVETGVAPDRMGMSPVPAMQKLVSKAGIAQDELDWIELNEAFGVQALACIRELGLDPAKVNPNGGAVALGHPVGCTGARLVVTLVHGLRRTSGSHGVATLCVSGGLGVALEVLVD